MKKIISVFTAAALALSMLCVSFTSYADGITVTFHSNNTSAASESFDKSLSEVGNMYDIPDVGNRFIFKGWYYGREENAQPVDFSNDTFSANTDVYAHWADIGVLKADAQDDSGTGFYDSFDLVGVQQRAGELDTVNGGLRFIGAVSNSLLKELDDLSSNVVRHENEGESELTYGANDNVEYGFVGAAHSRIEAWTNSSYAPTEYQLGYKGTNVNGVNTRDHNSNYQPVVNIDCTASDYSDSSIADYKNFSDYRLYSLAVTYENATEYDDKSLDVRAYLRYYDANGLLRTVYDDYDGTNEYGGLCTSYTTVRDTVVPVGYYSTIAGMFSDANNLNIANADSSATDAAASMYISGGRAYMKLLKNAELGNAERLGKKADLNLNGFTLNTGSQRFFADDDFSIYNGTCSAGASTSGFCTFNGNLAKVSNVTFSAHNIDDLSMVIGVLSQSKNVYISNCRFDIDGLTVAGNCFAVAFNNTKQAVVNNCTYDISVGITGQSSRMAAVYSNGSALTVDESSFSLEQTAHKPQVDVYGIMAWNSDNALLTDTEITISGECDYGYGVIASNGSSQSDARFFEASSLVIQMNIDDMYQTEAEEKNDPTSKVEGIEISKGETAVLNGVTTDITVTNACDAYVYGIAASSNSDTTASGLDIDIKTKNNAEDSYRLYGFITFDTSSLLLKSGEINVQPVLDTRDGTVEKNVGIRAENTSSVTIDPENDNDIYIQAGNAALSNDLDAVFTITGGKFCSPSHGGAYLGGNAEITGGEFYSYYYPGHTEEGAFYITYDAQVNISNAVIRTTSEGQSGLRTHDNKRNGLPYIGNPVVNVWNTTITGPVCGVNVSSGTVYLHRSGTGVNIQASTAINGNVVWVDD